MSKPSKLDTILLTLVEETPIQYYSGKLGTAKEQIKELFNDLVLDFTEVEDIPNQHTPAEYIGDVEGVRRRINEL